MKRKKGRRAQGKKTKYTYIGREDGEDYKVGETRFYPRKKKLDFTIKEQQCDVSKFHFFNFMCFEFSFYWF